MSIDGLNNAIYHLTKRKVNNISWKMDVQEIGDCKVLVTYSSVVGHFICIVHSISRNFFLSDMSVTGSKPKFIGTLDQITLRTIIDQASSPIDEERSMLLDNFMRKIRTL